MTYNPNRLINEYEKRWDGISWSKPRLIRQVTIKTLLDELGTIRSDDAIGIRVYVPADEEPNTHGA